MRPLTPRCQAEGPVEAKAGDEVPNFSLVNQDGKTKSRKDYRGSALLTLFIRAAPIPRSAIFDEHELRHSDQNLQKRREHLQSDAPAEYQFRSDDTPKYQCSYGAAFTGRYSDEDFQHWEFSREPKMR